ncbi:hypothetical protein OYC64_019430 [Pagothenia borchgrevinki]|uniref:Uncharacterized protein n=1 Tax=Pagothenia borchgrevinki TaxID=8213 RepID=A0ABD2FJU0_PAGBO
MGSINKSERWTDEEVSALLEIYAKEVGSVTNDDEGEDGQLSGLETSELSLPDHRACSSPLPATKRKGKRARAENFLDIIKASEDRRAVAMSRHRDQMALMVSKAQETDDKMLAVMERQNEALKRHMEHQDHQHEVWAQRREQRQERQDEQLATFQKKFLEVLSQLVKVNRSSTL